MQKGLRRIPNGAAPMGNRNGLGFWDDIDFAGWFDSATDTVTNAWDDFDFDFEGDAADVPTYTDTPKLPDFGNAGTSSFDFSNILTNLPEIYKAALQVNQIYQASKKPDVRTSSSTTVANPNGTLTTKTSTGSNVVTRMPAGTPYLAADGTMVMNNGNGSYTVTLTNGTQVTHQYPATNAGGGTILGMPAGTALLIGGGGLAAMYFLTRRK